MRRILEKKDMQKLRYLIFYMDKTLLFNPFVIAKV